MIGVLIAGAAALAVGGGAVYLYTRKGGASTAAATALATLAETDPALAAEMAVAAQQNEQLARQEHQDRQVAQAQSVVNQLQEKYDMQLQVVAAANDKMDGYDPFWESGKRRDARATRDAEVNTLAAHLVELKAAKDDLNRLRGMSASSF